MVLLAQWINLKLERKTHIIVKAIHYSIQPPTDYNSDHFDWNITEFKSIHLFYLFFLCKNCFRYRFKYTATVSKCFLFTLQRMVIQHRILHVKSNLILVESSSKII